MATYAEQLKNFTTKGLDRFLELAEDLFEEKADKMVEDTRAVIQEEDRIDTGALITEIKGIADLKGITLISDAKISGRKVSHASFNEYGTEKMKGIKHVEKGFNENIENIDNELDILILKAFNE